MAGLNGKLYPACWWEKPFLIIGSCFWRSRRMPGRGGAWILIRAFILTLIHFGYARLFAGS